MHASPGRTTPRSCGPLGKKLAHKFGSGMRLGQREAVCLSLVSGHCVAFARPILEGLVVPAFGPASLSKKPSRGPPGAL